MTLPALRAGDDAAWRALLDPLLPRLRAFLCARVGPDAADDVLSEVLLEVWQHLPTYEDRGHPISAWIWRIAHSRAIDEQRRHARALRHTTGDAHGLEHAPDEHDMAAAIAEADTLRQLWAQIETLPPRWAEVLRLRFAAELPPAEIAQRVGLTPGAVKMIQHRALVRLRRDLRSTHDHT